MSKVKIEIKSIFGKVLFTYECEENSIAKTVTEAVKSYANLSDADLSSANLSSADLRYADLSSADLRDADLRYADLSSADLRDADLRDADLRYANLSSADLRYANLSSADLRYANLRYANLSDADLRYADLSSADLRDADLRDADLRYANLSSADLRYANLSDVRNDLWDVLLRAPKEINGLKTAILEGKINGSVYEGECACLVGTIAKIRQCKYNNLKSITPNSTRPIERFFLGIKPGDTPETNQVSAIVSGWIDEFISLTTPPEIAA